MTQISVGSDDDAPLTDDELRELTAGMRLVDAATGEPITWQSILAMPSKPENAEAPAPKGGQS